VMLIDESLGRATKAARHSRVEGISDRRYVHTKRARRV
jgi:hypothetical protein